ncbi:ABC transporter permease subunit, partial [Pandoraea pneumonica]
IRRTIAGAFAVSTLLAGIAGVLIAPLFNVQADMGTVFGLKAFAVAILGGLSSAWGVMIAGLLFGVAEAMITATLGSGYTQII